jgi:rhodanese-related sulfurtransferase
MPRPRAPLALAVAVAALLAGCGAGASSTPAAATPAAATPAAATPAAATPAAVTLSPSIPTSSQVATLPSEVDVARVIALRGDGAYVLDVREPGEWAAGHIEGATLIPLGDLPSRLAEVPHDAKVVVVCRSGLRAAQGRDILLAAGYPAVTSLAGGMNAWVAAGQPVVTWS